MTKLLPPRELATSRTRLRPVAVGDADAVFEYASNLAVTRYMDWPRLTSIEQAADFVLRCERAWADGTAYPWAIVAKDGNRFVGVIELRLNPPTADFGYVLAERFWGRGIASEAAGAVVDWVWARSEVKRIWATCHPDNVASARVLTKIGLVFEARLEGVALRPQLGKGLWPKLLFSKVRV
ncbi:MAG: GNAT family N-acetyltransferase [Alphaproteobacteria bacterium]|nr:GNAT family N-acetyltransferase [Alphaproteobacteria bacterium]